MLLLAKSTQPLNHPMVNLASSSLQMAANVHGESSVRPPSFINFQAFAKMLEGHQLADFVAVLGSVNVIAAELDR